MIRIGNQWFTKEQLTLSRQYGVEWQDVWSAGDKLPHVSLGFTRGEGEDVSPEAVAKRQGISMAVDTAEEENARCRRLGRMLSASPAGHGKVRLWTGQLRESDVPRQLSRFGERLAKRAERQAPRMVNVEGTLVEFDR